MVDKHSNFVDLINVVLAVKNHVGSKQVINFNDLLFVAITVLHSEVGGVLHIDDHYEDLILVGEMFVGGCKVLPNRDRHRDSIIYKRSKESTYYLQENQNGIRDQSVTKRVQEGTDENSLLVPMLVVVPITKVAKNHYIYETIREVTKEPCIGNISVVQVLVFSS